MAPREERDGEVHLVFTGVHWAHDDFGYWSCGGSGNHAVAAGPPMAVERCEKSAGKRRRRTTIIQVGRIRRYL